MTKLPNFNNRVSQNATLHKPLEDLISSFYITQPKIMFVADPKWEWKYSGSESDLIGAVSVYCDSQFLGRLKVEYEDYRNFGRVDVFSVTSDKIIKKRGSQRQCMQTKDAHKALKTMQEVFVPKDTGGYKTRLRSDAESALHYMVSTAATKISNFARGRNLDELACFLLKCHDGEQPPIPDRIASMFAEGEKLQCFRDHKIAYSVFKDFYRGGVLVVEYSNGSMWYTYPSGDDHLVTNLTSTYDLPQNYQEKFALLKLCELSQPVENVGVKLNIEIERDRGAVFYYLTPGDTVITC